MIRDFEVADVDQERSRLKELIGELVLEPTPQPWGTRSMLFRDPDGNLINFLSRIVETAHTRGPASADLTRLVNGPGDLT